MSNTRKKRSLWKSVAKTGKKPDRVTPEMQAALEAKLKAKRVGVLRRRG